MNKKMHWETVYQSKADNEMSWFQTNPDISLKLISKADVGYHDKIIDVGGGTSLLVDRLVDQGFQSLTVLDISSAALKASQSRLDQQKNRIHWVESDIMEYQSSELFDLWHDRALFHFLTTKEDRQNYIAVMTQNLKKNGYLIIASFALNGPKKCSGLDVVQYSPQKLSSEIGSSYKLITALDETHRTPTGQEQQFIYSLFQKS